MDLIAILQQGGPWMVLLVLAYFLVDERVEHRKLRDRVYGQDGILEKCLNSQNAMSNAVHSLRDVLRSGH